MAILWTLDLSEIHWSKFRFKSMWSRTYYLRRTKFVVYQVAMILCAVSESVGKSALGDYVDQQDYVEGKNPKAKLHNNNFVGIAAFNMFVGGFIGTIFGGAFFFDLIWPVRRESLSVKRAWKTCGVLSCLSALADALAFTYIVAAKRAYVSGVSVDEAGRLVAEYDGGKPALRYKDNAKAVATVVLLWGGWVFTVWSTYLLWHSINHIDAHGPFSTHARDPTINNLVEHNGSGFTDAEVDGRGVVVPGEAHAKAEGAHDGNAGVNAV